MREARAIPPPWNLKLVEAPLFGRRAPFMREVRDVDLDYHVRHSALPTRRAARARDPRLAPAQPSAGSPSPALGGPSDRGARRQPLRHVQQDAPLARRRRQRDAADHARALQGSGPARDGLLLDRRRGRAPRACGREKRRHGTLGTPAQCRAWRGFRRRRALPRGARPGRRRGRRPGAPGSLPRARLGARREPRRTAALRHPAVRAQAAQAPGADRQLHAQRHRPLPERHRPAPLSRRARADPRPSADGRDPREPARGRRPVDGHRDRDDGRRAGHQRRQPDRAPAGDRALDRRGQAPPERARPRPARPTRCSSTARTSRG